MNAPTPQIMRVAWAEGSRLTHRDLADAIEHESRMLALHVVAMHGTWGIALGLRLSIGGDLHSVRLTAGGAYTARGESVVVAESMMVQGPAGASGVYDLLISPATARTECTRDVLPACAARTRTDAPVLRWVAASPFGLGEGVRLGREIPIGRVACAADGTLSGVDYSQRRTVTSLARPHVASGVALPGRVAWHAQNIGLYAKIDTDSAGFTSTPVYYATIGSDPPWPAQLVGPFLAIANPTATSFTVRLTFGAVTGAASSLFSLLEHAAEVDLRWIGVEAASGCPPTLASLFGISNPWTSP